MEHLKEIEFVKRHDVASAKLWYLIDAAWMKRWKLYVTKHGEHPGPISNSQLLQVETGFHATRKDLNVRQHYRGLGVELWTFFRRALEQGQWSAMISPFAELKQRLQGLLMSRQRYSGGPAIVHETIELKLARVLKDAAPVAPPDSLRSGSRGSSTCRTRSRTTNSPAATTTTTASCEQFGGWYTPTTRQSKCGASALAYTHVRAHTHTHTHAH
eukprot:3884554-Amphidinium_carterae.1